MTIGKINLPNLIEVIHNVHTQAAAAYDSVQNSFNQEKSIAPESDLKNNRLIDMSPQMEFKTIEQPHINQNVAELNQPSLEPHSLNLDGLKAAGLEQKQIIQEELKQAQIAQLNSNENKQSGIAVRG